MKRDIVLIAHNVRSAHNVGALLRTADCLGAKKVFLTGYTPYPIQKSDDRLPHLAQKTHNQIVKTALGAEKTVKWSQVTDIYAVLEQIRSKGYKLLALEQAKNSKPINDYQPPESSAIIVGREVEGIEPDVVKQCDDVIEIPMLGKKESLNVVQAAAIALYHCRFCYN